MQNLFLPATAARYAMWPAPGCGVGGCGVRVSAVVEGRVGNGVISFGGGVGGAFQRQHGKAFVLTGSIVLHNLLKVTHRPFQGFKSFRCPL